MATEIIIDSDLNVNGNLYDGYNIVGFNNINDFNKVIEYLRFKRESQVFYY